MTVLPSCKWLLSRIDCQSTNTDDSSRIQEALNRYQKKRRLLSERMKVFAQYLRYGGVDVGAKMFGGVSEQELKAMDTEGAIIARSQADIGVDKMKLDVDFELVVKSFL